MGQILERKKRHTPVEEKTSPKNPLEDLLETLEIPYPGEENLPAEVVFEEKEKAQELEVEKIQEINLEKKEKVEEIKLSKTEKGETISPHELETAIIYSAIIGPPRALQLRQGAKNRQVLH
ncbi:MAG: hypothetical protein NC927_00730 [Candidatus Omnitrophica bacterium]|nr:hypothetical protein [Candidatus Omnitrophota bacterium]